MRNKKFIALIMTMIMLVGSMPMTMVLADETDTDEELVIDEDIEAYAGEDIPVDASHFPDTAFRDIVSQIAGGDGVLSWSERSAVLKFVNGTNRNYYSLYNKGITSLEGIEYFPNINTLDCSNNPITTLDLTQNTRLTWVNCMNCSLTSIDVTGLTSLEDLLLHNLGYGNYRMHNQVPSRDTYPNTNNLTSIDLSTNTALAHVNLNGNNLSSLDVTNNHELLSLCCGDNNLSYLDLSNNRKLYFLDASSNNLTSIDLSVCTNISTLLINDNHLTTLDVFNTTDIDCSNNELTTLNIYSGPIGKNLVNLWCENNNLTQLPDFSDCFELRVIRCANNNITSIDVAEQDELNELSFYGNPIDYVDISDCPMLVTTYQEGDKTTTSEYSSWHRRDPVYYTHYYLETNPDTIINDGVNGAVTPTPMPDPRHQGVEEFIERLYTIALERASEEDGKAFWVDQVYNQGSTGGALASFFLMSPEFLNKNMNNEQFIEILYRVFFDREADDAGKSFWLNRLNNEGWSKSMIITEMINSTEWANICMIFGIESGGLGTADRHSSIVAFATRFYTTCLGRAAEEGGLNYWVGEIENGRIGGSDAAAQFFFGEEFTNAGYSNREYITRLYRTIMGREPDEGGMNYWLNRCLQLRGFTTRPDSEIRPIIFQEFSACQEWTDICTRYGITP